MPRCGSEREERVERGPTARRGGLARQGVIGGEAARVERRRHVEHAVADGDADGDAKVWRADGAARAKCAEGQVLQREVGARRVRRLDPRHVRPVVRLV